MKYCLFLLAIVASGQQVDRHYHLTVNGTPEVRDNRDVGCLGWAMDVTNNGFSALTVTLQSAVDNATWITFNGTTVSGSNPLTATGYYTATGFLPFVRVNITGISGTGSVDINLQCWKSPNYLAVLGGSVVPAAGVTGEISYYTSSTALGGNTGFIQNTTSLPVPAVPVLAKVGTGTGTTWGYTCIYKNLIGGSALGTELTISGNATLDGTHSINATCPTSTNTRVTSCDLYRTTAGGTPATTGIIGNAVCGTIISDTGLVALDYLGIPPGDLSVGAGSNVPYINTSQIFAGRLASIGFNAWNPYNGPSISNLGVFEHTVGMPSGDPFGAILLIDQSTNAHRFASTFEIDYETDGILGNYVAPIRSEIWDNGKTIGDTLLNAYFETHQTGALAAGGSMAGLYFKTSALGTSTDTSAGAGILGVWEQFTIGPSANIARHNGFWVQTINAGGTNNINMAYGSAAMGGLSTNPYPFWSDEAGVFRIRADNTFNSVYQAIPALYNPQFAKYTPGATDFERGIPGQWESNDYVITTEKGGSGTLRALKLGDANVPVKLGSLTAGAATGKRVVCIDDTTKQLYESSTGTDCSN